MNLEGYKAIVSLALNSSLHILANGAALGSQPQAALAANPCVVTICRKPISFTCGLPVLCASTILSKIE